MTDSSTVEFEATGQDPAASTALARARESATLEQQLEALLMVADEPISAVGLATATDRPVREVRKAIELLAADYDGKGFGPERGFELREVGGGYRFYVRESLDPIIADFVQQQSPARLSQAALETLAVIAYKQPVSRSQVGAVRGVNVDGVIRTLLSRGLIEEVGHEEDSHAILYGTTNVFLERMGLSGVEDLPALAPYLPDADLLDEIAERGRA